MKAIQLAISGKVQGVYFRVSAKKEADRLQITGFVRNMPDGSVFINAEGEESQLDKLVEWCKKGPPGAVVKEVRVIEINQQDFSSFEVYK